MSILGFLGLGGRQDDKAPLCEETSTVRRIVRELESLEPAQARFLAAFAYILTRVANVDFEISDEETREMESILRQIGKLPQDQAVLVIEISKAQNRLFSETEDFLVTRQFRDIASREQRLHLVDCLFAVSAADDSVSREEETLIRQIASELRLDHKDYITIRRRYTDKRNVMKSV